MTIPEVRNYLNLKSLNIFLNMNLLINKSIVDLLNGRFDEQVVEEILCGINFFSQFQNRTK
jgi:hypothetical protein